MESVEVRGPTACNSEDELDWTPAPDSSRHTTHTGRQSSFCGLGYGCGVAWRHSRPFIPFFLISFMVVALVFIMQHIIYGGPFKDPLFFVKFNERWPRPSLNTLDNQVPTKLFIPVPSSDSPVDNGTMWQLLWLELLCKTSCGCIITFSSFVNLETFWAEHDNSHAENTLC